MTPSKEDILGKHYPDFDKESGWMFDGAVENVFKAMDEYYNTAIDDCIEVLVKHKKIYEGVDDLISELEQLKKPNQ